MAGRPLGPHAQRFGLIGRRVEGIYLAEFGNGVVKVGQSGCLRTRLIGLDRDCRRNGHQIQRFAAFLGGYAREQACIDAITQGAAPIARHVEYFAGLDFEDAFALVEPVVADLICIRTTPA